MATAPRRPLVPRRVRLYVAAVAVAALILLPLSRLAAGTLHGPVAAFGALALAGLIVGAHRRPVQIGLKRKVDVGTAPEVAAVLLLPGPLAAFTLVVAALVGEAHLRAPLVQRLFNIALAMLRATAATAAYAAVLRVGPPTITTPAAMLAAAITMYVSTTFLVLGIAAVQLRENPIRRAWTGQRDVLVAEAALSLTGILTALATAQQAWALLLVAAPAVIAQRALRDGVALQAQTRLALEDLADVVDMRDHYTYEHSRRVAELARATARRLGLRADLVELVTMAGRVHDVGKIGIKSSVLMKPSRLTESEWQEMRSHPVVGARLIANFPQFARGRELVLHHHERFDGKGYPHGLAGDRIPFGARILAVADAWDAMTSHRAYRRALDLDHVRAEMERGSGTQFDPDVVRAFLAVLDERPDLATPAVQVEQDIDATPATAPEQAAVA
jgi:HD-GYP domain-containing protein (c-di-GMP phosphodiesterase class II)